MKPVRLKPNSPEFADEKRPSSHKKHCDMPGCECEASFRAPKDRSLSDHYWFCQQHISEYNSAWNYFSGMGEQDVQRYVYESLHGMRPTRPFSDWNKSIDELEAEIRAFRYGQDNRAQQQKRKPRRHDESSPERQALKELDLDETLDFNAIKTRYKELAKQLHPDINPGNPEAEDRLKKVNMAYTILKMKFAQEKLL